MMTRAIVFLSSLVLILSACSSPTKEREAVRLPPSSTANPLVPHNFGPNYKYNELMIKDYDEMLAMVQSFARKAHEVAAKPDDGGEGAAVEYLGRALKLIFSRPDSDNMVTKLLAEVRRDLVGYNAYDETIESLAIDAILNAKNQNSSVVGASTALVEIENIMAEIKPEVQNGNATQRRTLQRIRDAHIVMSDEVKRERRIRGMFRTFNPSEEARDMLRTIDKDKKKKS